MKNDESPQSPFEGLTQMDIPDPDALRRTLLPLRMRERLAMLRSMFNLSQEEAANLVRVYRSAWASWEAEEGNPRRQQPSPRSRARLAHVFRLPQSMFVDD